MIMSNSPKLRFKEFNEEWEEKKFGDIYSFFQTNSFSRALLNYENGKVKNIHYGDIHTKFKSNFFISNEKVPFINRDVDISKIKDENYCKEKDLVIADASEDYNDIGKTIEIIELDNSKLVAGLHTYIARDTKDKMALGFGGYFMQTHKVRLQMMKLATGISVLGISKGNLSKMNIILPSKQEQQKIASFLTSVDTKIEQLSKKEELLKEYKKGVMQKIFSQEIRFKNDDGNEFGEWKEKKLGELCKVAKSGGTPTSTNKDYYDGDIPFLAISDITSQGKYLTYTSKSVSQKGIDNSASWVVPENTIIYSMYASVGFVSINKIPLATSQAVINLILKDEADTEFIYYYLLDYKQYIHRFIETGTQGNLNAQTVKSLKVNLPCLEEQTKIANFLSSIDTKIEQTKSQLRLSKEFKKALLQQMFI
jgi:type I restriction enzyme S subunit